MLKETANSFEQRPQIIKFKYGLNMGFNLKILKPVAGLLVLRFPGNVAARIGQFIVAVVHENAERSNAVRRSKFASWCHFL